MDCCQTRKRRQLLKEFKISGRTFLGSGLCDGYTFSPEEPLEVKLYNSKGDLLKITKSDPEGSYEFSMPKGEYKITASNNSYYGEETINLFNNEILDIKLTGTKKNSEMVSSENYHGLHVEFIGYRAQIYKQVVDWNIISTKLKSIIRIVDPYLPLFKIVVIDSESAKNYGAYYGGICPNDLAYIATTGNLGASMRYYPVLNQTVHEFGHHYDFLDLRGKYERRFLERSYQSALQVGDCPFEKVSDFYILNHGSSGDHAKKNDMEFFASFFHAFYTNHDRLYEIIKNETTGECQNVLAYMWEFFSQEVGSVKSGDINRFPPKDGRLKLEPPRSIRKGWWRADMANEMSLMDRAQLLADSTSQNLHENKIFNTSTLWLEKINVGVSRFVSLGKDKSDVKIEVYRQIDEVSFPVGGISVQAGGFCVSDDQGLCSIKNVAVGKQKLIVRDKNNKRLIVFNEEGQPLTSVDIQKNKGVIKVFVSE
ncbi:MAG: hypothetical protein NT039_04075 [Candidatus Berkelbacteria bacterium]|nr:hypothetical protein [Candidatus Berkelbacteria bacterium]